MIDRRGLITGLVAFAATAPAIVRAGSLMKVKTEVQPLVRITRKRDWTVVAIVGSFGLPRPFERQVTVVNRMQTLNLTVQPFAGDLKIGDRLF